MISLQMQLLKAAEVGDCDKLKSLLKQNVDLNYKYRNSQCENAINTAAAYKHLDFMRLLLDSGANIDVVDYVGRTGLHYAAKHYDSEKFVPMIEYLLFRGFPVNVKDNFGWAPLHYASEQPDTDAIECLVLFGAVLIVTNNSYRMPYNKKVETLDLFVQLNFNDALTKTWPNDAIKTLVLKHLVKTEKEKQDIKDTTMARIRNKFGIRLMRFAQEDIIGICIALHSLDLTPYVILWIIDWLPNYDKLSHFKKIRLIESVRDSIKRLKK